MKKRIKKLGKKTSPSLDLSEAVDFSRTLYRIRDARGRKAERNYVIKIYERIFGEFPSQHLRQSILVGRIHYYLTQEAYQSAGVAIPARVQRRINVFLSFSETLEGLDPADISVKNAMDSAYPGGDMATIPQQPQKEICIMATKKATKKAPVKKATATKKPVKKVVKKAVKKAVKKVSEPGAVGVTKGPVKRIDCMGHPVTAVLRWMGEAGYSCKQARETMENMGIEVNKITVGCQVPAGRNPDKPRGESAQLTPAEVEEIEQYIPDAEPEEVEPEPEPKPKKVAKKPVKKVVKKAVKKKS